MTRLDSDPAARIDVPSPCVGICELEAATGWCRGCQRSSAEIAGWPRASAAEKLALLEVIGRRRARLRNDPQSDG